MKIPKTLFSRTLSMIAAVSVAYLFFSGIVISYFMLIPVGRQSADDLAALMVFSAGQWEKINIDERSEFKKNLLRKYNLKIAQSQVLKPVKFKPLPYYYFLESSLKARTGENVSLKISQDEEGLDWYWADLLINQKKIRIGFPSSHIDAQPPLVLILLLVVGGLATLSTAAVLVRHLTTPLEQLSRNALRIGSGEKAEFIIESGPDEMRNLAKSFNKMSMQVKDLLTNRTTLLAGISHDLRTPLARIQLALEMLPEDTDHSLVDGIRSDVNQMNCLIGQFLELSKNMEKGEQQDIDISEVLNDLINCSRRGGANIIWHKVDSCIVINNPMAVRRIIVNLLDNAVRYGEGHPVNVNYYCDKGVVLIRIQDQGPGIPADEIEAVFSPFYRLDQSRNTDTGGTGLGLSIAKQLAEINNIKIQLYSSINKGLTAEISIP